MKKSKHHKAGPVEASNLQSSSWFSSPRNQGWFIFFLALVLYSNTLSFDFNLDDGVVLTGNKFTLQGIKGIPGILSHDAFYGYFNSDQLLEAGRFRPLTQILFAIEYQLFGLNPFIGHLVNILAYAACCLLLFRVLQRLIPAEGLKRYLVFFAVLLYTAHPLHTEVVANIKGLDEIASFLFCLLALEAIIRYIDKGKIISLVSSTLYFFLAMLSKESAVTFIVIIPLTCWFFMNAGFRKLVGPAIALLAGFAVYMAMRFHAIGFPKAGETVAELLNDPFLDATLMQKYATIFYTWGKYFLLLLFPHPLTHDYYPKQIPIIGWSDLRAIIPLLVTLFLSFFAFWQLRKRNLYSFSILFFFLAFSVSSNLVVPVGTFMNERFMFVASLGFCLALSSLVLTLVKKIPAATTSMILILIPGLYSIKTITRNPAWKDGYTLFTTDVKVSSESAKCNTSAGGMMMEKALKMPQGTAKQQLLLQSVKYLEKAVAIYPRSFNAWLVLGRATIELKDFRYARLATENCLHINHTQPDAINNMIYLAQQFTKSADYAASVATYRSLLDIRPEKYTLGTEIAAGLLMMGKTDSAQIVLQKLIGEHPDYAPAYGKLGDIYGQQLHDLDKAMEQYEKAESLHVEDPTVFENMGVIYGMKKNYPESVSCFRKAIALAPKNASLYRNMATSYNNMGKKEEVKAALMIADSLQRISGSTAMQ